MTRNTPGEPFAEEETHPTTRDFARAATGDEANGRGQPSVPADQAGSRPVNAISCATASAPAAT
jgi:hypothetical protein